MKKKYEFKPDREGPSFLSRLTLTRLQRRHLLKWVLYALVLLALSVIQDVILCRVSLLGATTDLVPCAIFLVCVMEGAEKGSVFTLVASLCYLFSGAAPGPYVLVFLVVLAIAVTLLRQSYLQEHFGSTMLCAGLALVLYELALYAAGLVLELTRPDRIVGFGITAGLTLAALPLLYPVVLAIQRIGGEEWTD